MTKESAFDLRLSTPSRHVQPVPGIKRWHCIVTNTPAEFIGFSARKNYRATFFDQELLIFRPYHSIKENCNSVDDVGRAV